MPFQRLKTWLEEERDAGAPNPQQVVLSTATLSAVPHSRVVAIRDISEKGFLFFTQRGTRKVEEISANPNASMVFWFELKQREVIVEGVIEALSVEENAAYWETYPREAQARFLAYAPTSSQPIASKKVIEDLRQNILNNSNEKLAISPHYCGFRLKPSRFVFYAYRLDELSDVHEFNFQNDLWCKQLLSP